MSIEMTGEYTRRRSKPVHTLLGRDPWLLSIFIDAWADWNWGEWETALLGQTAMTPTRTDRQLHEFGIGDRHGLFIAAGLSENQRKVMEIRYHDDLQGRATLTPIEIAERLGWPSLRVRVHLHEGYERLRAWGKRQLEPLTISL